MGVSDITATPDTNTSLASEDILFPHFHLNQTDKELLLNSTGNYTEEDSMMGHDAGVGLSSSVIVAIAVGTTAFVVTVVTVIFVLIKKRFQSQKAKAWEDNLTLSYIADSNIDLTKDNYDEMISLDNDSFLNSLDTNSFSVFSPDSTTRQYTYSYF